MKYYRKRENESQPWTSIFAELLSKSLPTVRSFTLALGCFVIQIGWGELKYLLRCKNQQIEEIFVFLSNYKVIPNGPEAQTEVNKILFWKSIMKFSAHSDQFPIIYSQQIIFPQEWDEKVRLIHGSVLETFICHMSS